MQSRSLKYLKWLHGIFSCTGLGRKGGELEERECFESPGVSIIYQRTRSLCVLHIVPADSPSSATGAVGYFVNFRTSVIDNMSEGGLL